MLGALGGQKEASDYPETGFTKDCELLSEC